MAEESPKAPDAEPAAPVSPAKEWAAAAVIMVVFGLLIFAFVSFFRQ